MSGGGARIFVDHIQDGSTEIPVENENLCSPTWADYCPSLFM
jgi:hypothetical protein